MRNISNMVRTQFPKFMREGNHEKFVAFLEAYYDYLDTQGRPNDIISSFNDLNDVDKTLEPFLQNFIESFAFAIPSRFFSTKRDAIKHFKEIHSIKGTPRSYELLFRFLYDELIEFYFPEIDIFRTSASKWQRINMVAIQSDVYPDVIYKTMVSENTRFFVNNVKIVSRKYNIYFVEFAGETFEGYFDPGSDTQFWVEGEETVSLTWNMRPYNAVSGVRIKEAGAGYEEGTEFIFSEGIHRTNLVVDRVGPDGEIMTLRIRSQNYLFNPVPTSVPPPPSLMPSHVVIPVPYPATDISSTGWLQSVHFIYFGRQAEIELLYDPFFIVNQPSPETFNQPSGRSKIQDGVFYSPYTYVIKTGHSIDLWRDMLYKMVHPAGMAVFSQILILSVSRALAQDSSRISQIIVYLYNWQVKGGIHKALQVFAEARTELKLVLVPSSYTRNITYFDDWKFLVPPYAAGTAALEIQREDWTEYYSADLGTPLPAPTEFNTDAIYYQNGTFLHSHFNVGTLGNLKFEQFLEPEKHPATLQPGSFIKIVGLTHQVLEGWSDPDVTSWESYWDYPRGVGNITGTGDFVGIGSSLSVGTGLLSDSGTLSGVGLVPARLGTGLLSDSGTLSGVGEIPSILMNEGNGLISENGNLTGTGLTDSNGTGLITENGVVAGVGEQPAASATPLAHYWALDETSGTAVIDSVGGQTGEVINDASDDTIAVGKFGNARDLGASPGLVSGINLRGSNPIDNNYKLNEWTISLWFKHPESRYALYPGNNAPEILNIGDWTNASTVHVFLNPGWKAAEIELDVYNESNNYVGGDSFSVIPTDWADVWHHVVVKCDGVTTKLYLDGVLVIDFLGAVPLMPRAEWAMAGASEEEIFAGALDDIAIWNIPLSDAEITSLWNSGTGITADQLAASETPLLSAHYWALDETGNQLSDSVGDLGTVTVKGDATGVSSVVAPSPFGRARDFGDAEYMFDLWDGTKNTTETIPVWSLSFRVFRNGAAPDWSDIFYQGDANVSNDFIALYVDEDGSTLYVDTRKNQGAWVSIDPILATPLWNGDWHRITLVSDGTTISVYVDTALVGTLASTVVLTPKNAMTFGGSFQASMSQYNAYAYNVIDDIAIFNQVIVPSNINGFLTLPAAQWTV